MFKSLLGLGVHGLDRGLPPSAYSQYMCSPQWAAKREWWKAHRSSARRRCQVCGNRQYHLHHRTYVRLGREHLRDLVALCERHHDSLHALKDRTGWTVERASTVYLTRCRVRRMTAPLTVALAVAAIVVLFR